MARALCCPLVAAAGLPVLLWIANLTHDVPFEGLRVPPSHFCVWLSWENGIWLHHVEAWDEGSGPGGLVLEGRGELCRLSPSNPV